MSKVTDSDSLDKDKDWDAFMQGADIDSITGVIEQAETPKEPEVVQDTDGPECISGDDPDVVIGPRINNKYKYNFSELGNAELLTRIYHSKLRYCIDIKKWLYWDDKKWSIDNEALIAQFYMDKALRKYRKFIKDGDYPKKFKEDVWTYCLKNENLGKCANSVRKAKTLHPFKTNISEFNSNNFLLNVENGTIDLKTGKIKDFNPSDKLTQMANVKHDKNATCPIWEKSISEYMMGNTEMINYLQELLGMVLTGDRTARIFPIFVGRGSNGKSVVVDTVKELLGNDYFWKAPSGFLEKSKFSKTEASAIAQLKGRRFVIISEIPKGFKIDVAFLKEMTGDIDITGRALYQDPSTFKVTHKCILVTNSLTEIVEHKDAIWDNVHKID